MSNKVDTAGGPTPKEAFAQPAQEMGVLPPKSLLDRIEWTGRFLCLVEIRCKRNPKRCERGAPFALNGGC